MSGFAVETQNLTRRFGVFTAVNNINLNIETGSIYGFLGPNGSGKSTTIRMLCGIISPSDGSGSILGLDLVRDSEAIKSQIGYMSQKFSLYDDLTVRENLNFYAGMYDLYGKKKEDRIAAMLNMAGLQDRQNELASDLSGGWKQRLALGCSILHNPPILFLDEPTGGVDPKSRRLFWDIIYKLASEGTTVMVTTHFMDEAEHCDRIGFIHEGELIADDTPGNLKKILPGILLEIPSANPMALMQSVQERNLPAFDVYPYGTRLHVLVHPEELIHYAGYEHRQIEPSLEDVFIYYVKSRRRG